MLGTPPHGQRGFMEDESRQNENIDFLRGRPGALPRDCHGTTLFVYQNNTKVIVLLKRNDRFSRMCALYTRNGRLGRGDVVFGEGPV